MLSRFRSYVDSHMRGALVNVKQAIAAAIVAELAHGLDPIASPA